jgi:hypothetical protein
MLKIVAWCGQLGVFQLGRFAVSLKSLQDIIKHMMSTFYNLASSHADRDVDGTCVL